MNSQAARDRLATAEKKLAELELENRKMKTTLQGLQNEKKSVEQERASLAGEHRNVSQELAEIKRTASSALAIDSENKELKSRVVSLERKLQTVHQENEVLKDRTDRDWFMVGSGVVLLGIIVGLIIPRIRWRKKSSWDTFLGSKASGAVRCAIAPYIILPASAVIDNITGARSGNVQMSNTLAT